MCRSDKLKHLNYVPEVFGFVLIQSTLGLLINVIRLLARCPSKMTGVGGKELCPPLPPLSGPSVPAIIDRGDRGRAPRQALPLLLIWPCSPRSPLLSPCPTPCHVGSEPISSPSTSTSKEQGWEGGRGQCHCPCPPTPALLGDDGD